jgi:hypothetical protein
VLQDLAEGHLAHRARGRLVHLRPVLDTAEAEEVLAASDLATLLDRPATREHRPGVSRAPKEALGQASGASTWSWSCALEADAAARVSVGAVGAALEHAALLQVVVHRTAKPAPQHKNQNATVELPGGARVTSSALAKFCPLQRGGEAQEVVASKLGDV